MRKTKKSVICLILLAFCVMMVFPVYGYAEEIPLGEEANISEKFIDINFRNAVTDWLELPRGSAFTEEDITSAMERNRHSLRVNGRGISDLSGLEYFKELVDLECDENYLVELPELPAGLQVLQCRHNQLSGLPELPNSLGYLACDWNQLTGLPELPNSLRYLICDWNQLTGLPELPEGLEWLHCCTNQLTELPELPEGLEWLGCDTNQLTGLPELPEGLQKLICGANQLTELPKLPDSLQWLACSENPLTGLPELPEELQDLFCALNQLTALPELPDGLGTLCCSCNYLTELPELPEGLAWLLCDSIQLTELPELPEKLEWLYCNRNQLAELPGLPDSLQRLCCSQNQLTELPELPEGLEWLLCDGNQLTELPELPEKLTHLKSGFNYIDVWSSYSGCTLKRFPGLIPQLRVFLEGTTGLELLPGGSAQLEVAKKVSIDGVYWTEECWNEEAERWEKVGGWINPSSLDWCSSDESVATVSADGLVTGHASGGCTVTGRYLSIEGEFTTVNIPVLVNQQPGEPGDIVEPLDPEEPEEPEDTEAQKEVKKDTGNNGKKLPRTGGFALPCILVGIALTAAGLHLRRSNK